MIRARPVTFAGGLLLEDAPEEQKETPPRRKRDGIEEGKPAAGQAGRERSR